LDSSASSELANEKAIGPILDLPEEKFVIEADKVGDLGSASIYRQATNYVQRDFN
jgi:hypothetical protein